LVGAPPHRDLIPDLMIPHGDRMMKTTTALGLTLLLAAGTAGAGALDPDCTAEKAAVRP
jgi:hypothetical protein